MPGVAAFPVGDITFLSLLFNFYGYYLPIFLYAAWTPLALYEVSDNRLELQFIQSYLDINYIAGATIRSCNLPYFFC